MQDFLEAYRSGRVCLHPTDSLIGLTADPRNPGAIESLRELKGNRDDKAFLGLVSDLGMALEYWQSLPPVWSSFLSRFWPSPLTVIWKASEKAPSSMVFGDGTIALRRPALTHDKTWLYDAIHMIDCPMPSTSANLAGEPPAGSAKEAAAVFGARVFIEETLFEAESANPGKPSTLIKIVDDKSYELLREGAVSKELIDIHLELSSSMIGVNDHWLSQLSDFTAYHTMFTGIDKSKYEVILGSSSPRRKDLLRYAGFDYRIIKPNYEELRRDDESATDYVQRNSLEKAKSIAAQLEPNGLPGAVIISADTVVALDNRCLEKPQDREEAFKMLKSLSGREHSVFTGTCLLTSGDGAYETKVDVTESKVKFKPLSDKLIQDYIATNEPMDKAGSYGMQGIGSFLIESIEGSLSNIIGLPMETLRKRVAQLG